MAANKVVKNEVNVMPVKEEIRNLLHVELTEEDAEIGLQILAEKLADQRQSLNLELTDVCKAITTLNSKLSPDEFKGVFHKVGEESDYLDSILLSVRWQAIYRATCELEYHEKEQQRCEQDVITAYERYFELKRRLIKAAELPF